MHICKRVREMKSELFSAYNADNAVKRPISGGKVPDNSFSRIELRCEMSHSAKTA